MKLVRVVLFLPWASRDGWNSFLVEAAKRTHADNTDKNCPKFPLTDKGEKTGEIRRYTGQFSQYPLVADPDKKLFGNYEMWRFLEVLEAKGMGTVLCDSYVYFCEDIKQDGSSLCIDELNPSKYDGGFECKYKRISQSDKKGRSPGMPLPFPPGLECYAKNATLKDATLRQYVRCPHGPDSLEMNGWDVKLNVSHGIIKSGFRDEDSFSPHNFLKKGINMKIFAIISHGAFTNMNAVLARQQNRDVAALELNEIVRLEAPDGNTLFICRAEGEGRGGFVEILDKELEQDSEVYVHVDAGSSWDTTVRDQINRWNFSTKVPIRHFSIMAWQPPEVMWQQTQGKSADELCDARRGDFIRILYQAITSGRALEPRHAKLKGTISTIREILRETCSHET